MNGAHAKKRRSTGMLYPVAGIILFVCLYIISAFLYPGGYGGNPAASGFSWLHNYWCNLLNEKALNGEVNTGRPVAICGLFTMCISLAWFWAGFPRWIKNKSVWRKIIPVSGLLSMGFAAFLFTGFNHDTITNAAGGFGLISLAGTMLLLFQPPYRFYFYAGLFNMILVLLNFGLYHSPALIRFLPVVQKISFGFVLMWISLLCIKLFRKNKIAVLQEI